MAFQVFSKFSKDSLSLPREKKQIIMIIVLAAVVLITVTVLYFGFLRPSAPVAPAEEPGGAGTGVPLVYSLENIIKKIDFDVAFLKNPHFQSLKAYGEWPLSVEDKGRSNPFLPY